MITYTDKYILKSAKQFVNPRTGIICEAFQKYRNWGDENQNHFSCKLADMRKVTDIEQYPLASTSSSSSKIKANISAICEGLERYCGVMQRFDETLKYFSIEENKKLNLLNINLFPTCIEEEYENPYNFLSPPNIKQKYYWVKCWDFINQKEIYIPSSYIYLQLIGQTELEYIHLPNSTGTAGGQTIEMASIGAILELLERDAIMLTWLYKLPRHQVEQTSITDSEIKSKIEKFERNLVKPFLFDISTDFSVPTTMCILVSNTFPYITVTAATKIQRKDSMMRALDEGLTTRSFGMANKAKFQIKNYEKDFSNVIDFEDHFLLYNKSGMRDKLNFLLNGTKMKSYEELIDNSDLEEKSDSKILSWLLKQFQRKKYDLIMKDITSSDLSDSIFKFVKVFSPQLLFLSQNQNMQFLNKFYRESALIELGFRDYINNPLNKLPHPFA